MARKCREPHQRLLALPASPDDFIGRLKGLVNITGDIESPLEPLESWKALR